MATSTQMQMLAGKAFYDDNFRQRLLADPAAAAAEYGVTLTETQIEYIRGLDPREMDKLARRVRAGMPPPRMPLAWGG